MALKADYEPRYSNSWALLIGINKYDHAPPLGYARNDADKVAETLRNKLAFPSENIELLQDADATRSNILAKFLEFASAKVQPNDRIVVFFAGHGFTKEGHRGEIGYLVPSDGNTEDLSTLLRWDDLTRNAEVVTAKHILFIMDACYGGLAVQRSLAPGSMRFAKDMIKRFSRQVLTAGKADEVVADSGGPREGHSVFTGHLLDAMEGAAATVDRVLTANGVMAYVYDRVAKDYQSNQTPHYGFLDGDGDMILDDTPLENLDDDQQTDHDILVEIPASLEFRTENPQTKTLSDSFKEYVSDPRLRIRLHDSLASEVRKVMAKINEVVSAGQGTTVKVDVIPNTLREFEEIVSDLADALIILCRWGTSEHRSNIQQALSHLSSTNLVSGGSGLPQRMLWYPMMYLTYVSGIGALCAGNYQILAEVLLAPVAKRHSGEATEPIVVSITKGFGEFGHNDIFKSVSGHERHHVPRSEYLFKVIQPCVEDMLFLGSDYERLFDRFEILFSLVYADRNFSFNDERAWGPAGRFWWKYSSRDSEQNPFDQVVEEANIQKHNWPPIRAGLFDGSMERFSMIAQKHRNILDTVSWY